MVYFLLPCSIEHVLEDGFQADDRQMIDIDDRLIDLMNTTGLEGDIGIVTVQPYVRPFENCFNNAILYPKALKEHFTPLNHRVTFDLVL